MVSRFSQSSGQPMKTDPSSSKTGFLKSYILPALIIFLMPAFGLWFFSHVENYYDGEFRDSLVSQVRTDAAMSEEDRKNTIEFYERVPISKILASNKSEVRDLQEQFASVSKRYAVFRWMRRASAVSLISSVAVFLAVGAGVVLSFRSQRAQYWSLRIGWNVLRWYALIQVVCQGALAVALSFWITAFWFERYFMKLIIAAAILAGVGVLQLVKAIFSKVTSESRFDGLLLTKEAAPLLWQRVSEMASRLGIAPPDHIFVGIDDNFFVTEHEVVVGEQRFQGRTLFASLSLLKTLTRSEADAVLAHELAHFSGDDTLYSRKISPLLGKYAQYLNALYEGGIGKVVFYVMHLFWNLYQMSLGKLSREREFRADRIGGELTAPQDMGNALVKIAAYCRYRHKVQSNLFGKEENVKIMDVSAQIEKGFPDFAVACANGTELAESGTPHPFDTHPPLASRLKSLGIDSDSALKVPIQLPALADSWFPAIESAAEVEAAQWKEFEGNFHKAHEESLAWRFKPEGEAEVAHVAKFFPETGFSSPKGVTATIDYEKVNVSDWEAPITFASMGECTMEDHLGGKRLIIKYREDDQSNKTRKLQFKDLKGSQPGTDFLTVFQNYYGRYLASKRYHELKAEEAAEKQSQTAGGETKTGK